MSEKSRAPAVLGQFIGAFCVGAAAAAAATAGMAALMAQQGLSQDSVWPLATAAVSGGSLISGWLAALLHKSGGLACGAVQGVLFAALLGGLPLLYGQQPDGMQLARLGVVVLFGCVGGVLGRLRADRRRRR